MGTPRLAAIFLICFIGCKTRQLSTTACSAATNGLIDATQCAGSSADAKVNACIHGAVSAHYTCDARGLGGDQDVLAQIDVGDHNQDAVTLLLPKSGTWHVKLNDAASCALKQYGNSALVGTNTGIPVGITITSQSHSAYSVSASSAKMPTPTQHAAKAAGTYSSNQFTLVTDTPINIGAMYCTETGPEMIGGGSYLRAEGFAIHNIAGAKMAKGATVMVDGLFDNSHLDQILVFDGSNTNMSVVGSCCGTSFDHITLDGKGTAPGPSLLIANTDNGQYNEAITFDHLSPGHPGPGYNNVKIAHTGANTFGWWDTVRFYDLYLEGNTSDTTTPLVSIDSAYNVSIYGVTGLRMAPGSVAPMIELSHNAAPYVRTQLVIEDLNWAAANGTTDPITIRDLIHGKTINADNLGISASPGALTRYATSPAQ